jgi:hypothetical protein
MQENEQDGKNKTIPHRTWQSIKLQRAFEGMNVGEMMTYAELGKVIDQPDVRHKVVSRGGVDVLSSTRHILDGAINRALRDSGVVVVCVHNEGYRRVGAGEKLDPVGQIVGHMRRRAQKACRILRTLNSSEWSEMSPDDRATAVARKLQNEEIVDACKAGTLRKAKEMATANNPELPAWAVGGDE